MARGRRQLSRATRCVCGAVRRGGAQLSAVMKSEILLNGHCTLIGESEGSLKWQ